MRILIAMALVALFGAVAIATSAVRGDVRAPAASTVAPRYAPIPPGATHPPDLIADRQVRQRAPLFGRFAVPVDDVGVPDDPDLLPGAPRDYRAGIHEGIDFPAAPGTPVHAAADGVVIRVDTSFLDWTREQQEIALYEALQLGYTPAATLDRIRGRQVWIDHGGGVVTRYAHLSAVETPTVGHRL